MRDSKNRQGGLGCEILYRASPEALEGTLRKT
jgi:hypothetical protein